MRLQCQDCGKQFNLPQDKIPETGHFAFTCPNCKKKNKVELNLGKDTSARTAGRPQSESPAPPEARVEPDLFPPGSKAGFVYLQDEAWFGKVHDSLTAKGYYLSQPSSPQEAVQKLRLNVYDLVCIEDSPDAEGLLQEISLWPGRRRREVNCLLLGEYDRSFDPAVTFIRAVNCVLAKKDIESAHTLLEQADEQFEKCIEPWHAV